MRWIEIKLAIKEQPIKESEYSQRRMRAVRQRNADLATRRLIQQHNQDIEETDDVDAAQQRIDRLDNQKDLENIRKKRAEIQKKQKQIKNLQK